MRGLPIRTELGATELRALARRETRPRVAPRLYAIAHVLDGVSRAEAARLCGMDRQALRDAVVRFNAEGLDGLVDRPRLGREPRLSEGEQAALAGLILRGPRPEQSGVSSWTLADLLDQAGWHGARALRIPGNVTLVPLPPYAPELNPVERVWLYLREAPSSRTGCSTTTTPSSMPAAPPGTASRQNASARCAATHTSNRLTAKLSGIIDLIRFLLSKTRTFCHTFYSG